MKSTPVIKNFYRTIAQRTRKRQGAILWITGLSCSGKTTLARGLVRQLKKRRIPFQHLDGDILRRTLTSHLGFSKGDRLKNLALAAILAKEISTHGITVIATFISPFREQRELFRRTIPRFYEIYLAASLKQCMQRDRRGLYRLAKCGKIKNFTGISHPYEQPCHPDLLIPTGDQTPAESLQMLVNFLKQKKVI